MRITKQQLIDAFTQWADAIETQPDNFYGSLTVTNAEEAADYLWDLLEEIQQDTTTPPHQHV